MIPDIHIISCGAVVFTRQGGGIRYVIICSKDGYNGFPKGRMEAQETEQETALREIREETGLSVALIPGFRAEDAYRLVREGKPHVVKHEVYFLAEYADQRLMAQPEELSGVRLLDYAGAMAVIQSESTRRILTEANTFITGNL